MLLQLLLNGICLSPLLALLSLSFGIFYRVSGFFVFTFASCFAIAPYAAIALEQTRAPRVFCDAVGVIASVFCGVSFELLFYRRLRAARSGPLVMMITSIGIYVIGQNLLSSVFGDSTITRRASSSAVFLELLDSYISITQFNILLVCSAVIVAFSSLLYLTTFGAACRAVASDVRLAAIYGLSTQRIISSASAVFSGGAGIAGILVSYDLGMTPGMGFDALLWAAIGAIIGGVATFTGPIVGGVAISLTYSLTPLFLPIAWQRTSLFLIFLFVLIYRPNGLLSNSRSDL